MARLKAGDRVSCKLKESKITSPYADFDDIKTFEIIGIDEHLNGYYLYIPSYIFVKDCLKVDNYNYKKFNVAAKYIGDDYVFIEEKLVHQVVFILEGTCCFRCKEFFDYVQNTDEKWLCYSCNKDPYR